MRYKKKLIVLIALVIVLTIIQYALPAHSRVVGWYNAYVFHPFQSLRNMVFSVAPFSVGDWLYLVGGAVLLVVFVRWLYFAWHFKAHRYRLGDSILLTFIAIGGLYIVFILGYGGNYYKPSLSTYWGLDKADWENDTTLEAFDRFLIGRLNDYAPGYRAASFRDIDRSARVYYQAYTDSRTRHYGVKAKPSLFGTAMHYFGIQGYYNPWTGEAQVNKGLPPFMLPFVVCHEMAHQSGIAAEDDANLLSYAVGTLAPDSVFRYSAYFNLWLYAHARLRRQDSAKARQLRATLNPITLAHLDTLRAIRRRYDSPVSNYSGAIYDGYLKLHQQRDGIESYNKVTITAWAWEQQKKDIVNIP